MFKITYTFYSFKTHVTNHVLLYYLQYLLLFLLFPPADKFNHLDTFMPFGKVCFYYKHW